VNERIWRDFARSGSVADLTELRAMGRILDTRPASLWGRTVLVFLAESLLRIRTRDGGTAALCANGAQLHYEKSRGQKNIVLKARQMGMTTWLAGRFFLKTITTPGTMTVMVAQTREAAEGIFRIVQRFHENLPEQLRDGALKTERDNIGQMTFTQLDSEFRVLSAGDANAGRGLTIQNLHCSEVARWQGNAVETLAGLRAALSPAGELVMESTPNGAYGCFYDEWQRADANGTVKHFMPWWMERQYAAAEVLESSLSEAERGLCRRHGLTLKQIGFRRVIAENYRSLAGQEYAEDAESCFLASGDCVFDIDALEKLAAREPMEQRSNKTLQVWYPPLAGKQYLVAVDPAGGGSAGDWSTAQVIEVSTGMQCAELQAKLNPRELAVAVVALAKEYMQALLIIERNNHGVGVLAFLETAAPYARVYEQHGLPGWLTTAVSRTEMIGRLGALLVERPELFSSRRLLAECRTFVRLQNGRCEAAAGAHDDCVMAMAIAQAVRAERVEKVRRQ